VPASDYRALQSQVRELQRLLGKKTLEAEILKYFLVLDCLEHVVGRGTVESHDFPPGSDRNRVS
jgi:hypothetical protein